MTFWTDEIVEKLRTLHAEKVSFSLIAVALGCTKNAAIGKALRLGLPRRERPINYNKAANKAKKIRIAPRMSRETHLMHVAEWSNLPLNQSENAVSLLEIKSRQCRWPLNDPGPGFLFCGAEQLEDSSYCCRHHLQAHDRGPDSARFNDGVSDSRTYRARKRFMSAQEALNSLVWLDNEAA